MSASTTSTTTSTTVVWLLLVVGCWYVCVVLSWCVYVCLWACRQGQELAPRRKGAQIARRFVLLLPHIHPELLLDWCKQLHHWWFGWHVLLAPCGSINRRDVGQDMLLKCRVISLWLLTNIITIRVFCVDCDVSTKVQEEIERSLDSARSGAYQDPHLGQAVEPPPQECAVWQYGVSQQDQAYLQDNDPAAIQPAAKLEKSFNWWGVSVVVVYFSVVGIYAQVLTLPPMESMSCIASVCFIVLYCAVLFSVA